MEPKRHLISSDGMTFREATPDEISIIELEATDEQTKREEALKKELSREDFVFIHKMMQTLQRNNILNEEYYKRIQELEKKYPYRDFGRLSFMEAIGYTEDTIDDLKRVIGVK